MYINPQYLSLRRGRQCPECHKERPNSRLRLFKTNFGLIRHVVFHDLPIENRREIAILLKEWDEKTSFIQHCVNRGYLY